MWRFVLVGLVAVCGCSSAPPVEPELPASVSLTHASGTSGLRHLVRVPVVVNGHETSFILDTGIGITLVDDDLIESWGIAVEGSYTGKRMSGQDVTVPLARVPWLSVAGQREDDVEVGVWDVQSFLPRTPEFAGVQGYLSLNAFTKLPFTLDYAQGRLILEDEAGLAKRVAAGAIVPLEVHRDGPTLTVFFDLAVPGGPPARVELDLGSGSLILDTSYMERLGVDPKDPEVEGVLGRDETDHDYSRYFAKLAGPIAPVDAPGYEQRDFTVMFQDIIYDGLIGDAYMRRHTATFDLAGARLILGPPGEPTQTR